ncbi:hypothetical protein Mspyr1_06110 [Mycolicibacterium gilvum Spyr1]|uniref:Uncharacterized protein n=1 Tax=Mycolicibacterium gilvum (strain DSM 45189 / LMG 24558 / Spyr1) TaxID=278137 RepID=E6TA44_MYCSR|nr:hypothetical protein Mspyr1_06110 [Mycolicibacterium gilvum Spyr1]
MSPSSESPSRAAIRERKTTPPLNNTRTDSRAENITYRDEPNTAPTSAIP